MTTLDHRLPRTGTARKGFGQHARVPRGLALLAGNAALRMFATLLVISAGAALLIVGIGCVLDAVLPVIAGDELRALAALFPQR